MAPDDHSGARPAGPVVLRIKLRYDDVEAMVQRFASNVGKSGLFLPTRSIQPVGTEVKFELRLANDTPVLVGMGRVRYAQKPDPANPRAVFGMAIELTRVSRDGRSIIIRMIERRRALGLPDVSIPLPEDIDAARRGEVETQPRSETSAVVRDAMTQLASAPTAEPLTGEQPASGPIGVAKSEPSRPSSPLLTSARPGSGPIALLRDEHSARVPVPVLAPEKSRPRRPRVQELIDRASELSAPIIAALPAVELDMHVDVESVLARARSLAGGELDAELDRLRDAAAAPIEISVEAASAELARQLGGKPVAKRERSGSARWAPPPAIETRTVTPSETSAEAPRSVDTSAVPEPAPESVAPSGEFSSKLRAPTEAAPAAAIAAVVEAAVASTPDTAVASAPAPATVDDDAETPVLDGDDYAEAFVPNPTAVTGVEAVLDPATEQPKSFASAHDVKTEPTNRVLMIDDDADVSSFERALDEAGGDRTQIGGGYPPPPDQLAAQLDRQLAEAERELERELAADAVGTDDDAPVEEVSELDVLAEADEEDADLLGARGEAELSGGAAPMQPIEDSGYDDAVTPPPVDVSYPYESAPELYAYAPPARESADDFAARLDLGDDDEPPPSEDFDRDAAREFDAQVTKAVEDDYAEHLRRYGAPAPSFESPAPAQPSYDDRAPRQRRPSSEPSSSYTFAENYPEAGLHLGGDAADEFDEPHSYAPAPKPEPRKLRGPDPRLLRYGRATTASTEDLEDALAALDVDFDDLSADQRRSHRTSSRSSQPRPLPGLPIERPPTGQQPIVTKPATARPVPAATPPPGSPTGAQPAVKRTTKPPPIPAAARKQPTRQVPVIQTPKRAPTEDDAVLIDFDDDE